MSLDFARRKRTGLDEAVLCAGKTSEQITDLLKEMVSKWGNCYTGLQTSRSSDRCLAAEHLGVFTLVPASLIEDKTEFMETLDHGCEDSDTKVTYSYFKRSRLLTVSFSHRDVKKRTPASLWDVTNRTCGEVVCLSAGHSDATAMYPCVDLLECLHVATSVYEDCGVVGMWRLERAVAKIPVDAVVITFAGMDGSLPTVLSGMIPNPIIAVPTSTGYGVAYSGETALNAALSSCGQGVTVMNIDNGFGAVQAALRILNFVRVIQND